MVRALGADHVSDSRGGDIAAEVLRLTGGAGADLVLESVGGVTLDASLAATKRVTRPGRRLWRGRRLEARAAVGKLALLP